MYVPRRTSGRKNRTWKKIIQVSRRVEVWVGSLQDSVARFHHISYLISFHFRDKRGIKRRKEEQINPKIEKKKKDMEYLFVPGLNRDPHNTIKLKPKGQNDKINRKKLSVLLISKGHIGAKINVCSCLAALR